MPFQSFRSWSEHTETDPKSIGSDLHRFVGTAPGIGGLVSFGLQADLGLKSAIPERSRADLGLKSAIPERFAGRFWLKVCRALLAQPSGLRAQICRTQCSTVSRWFQTVWTSSTTDFRWAWAAPVKSNVVRSSNMLLDLRTNMLGPVTFWLDPTNSAPQAANWLDLAKTLLDPAKFVLEQNLSYICPLRRRPS